VSPRQSIVIAGGGGHGRVVREILSFEPYCSRFLVSGVLDDALPEGDVIFEDAPVLGPVDGRTLEANGYFIAAIGDNRTRRMIFERLGGAVRSPRLIHPATIISESATIEPGTVVVAGAVINPEAAVGENVIINTGATVGHHVHVSSHCHVAPGVNLGGGSRMEMGALAAIGSVVVPSVTMGAWSILGAGSVATRDIPAGAVALGIPAEW
jgi:acetyltransferase EpsM